MPKVTALRIQKRRKNRVNVFLDGEYAFSLQDTVAATLRLDQTLTEQEIKALKQRDNSERAYERALSYLTYRPRSRQEIQHYLEGKEVDRETIDSVLTRLERNHLVDDRDLARYWVENRQTFRPRGPWALRAELRRKGIAPQVIEEAIQPLDEETEALHAAERVLRRMARLDRETFRRRLWSYLQRRGFGYEVARRVTDRLWQQVSNQQQAGPKGQASADDE